MPYLDYQNALFGRLEFGTMDFEILENYMFGCSVAHWLFEISKSDIWDFLWYVGYLKSRKVTCLEFLWYFGFLKSRKVTCVDFLWYVGFLKSRKVTFLDFENLET